MKCDTGLLDDKAREGNCQHYLFPSMHGSLISEGGGAALTHHTVTCSETDEKSLSFARAISYSLCISWCVCLHRSDGKINRIGKSIFYEMFSSALTQGKTQAIQVFMYVAFVHTH